MFLQTYYVNWDCVFSQICAFLGTAAVVLHDVSVKTLLKNLIWKDNCTNYNSLINVVFGYVTEIKSLSEVHKIFLRIESN